MPAIDVHSTDIDTTGMLRTAAAAELISVSSRGLLRYAAEGRLPVWRLPSGERRFRRADVLALLRRSDS